MIIPAEIKNDELYYSIIDLVCSNRDEISNIIEIGASSGDGSTEAFIKGIEKSGKRIDLYSFEINKQRFSLLSERYRNLEFFHPLNQSSVGIDEYPTEEDIKLFYNSVKTNLNQYSLDRVLSWYYEEKKYIKENNIEEDGIEKLKRSSQLNVAFIDGSAFTGYQELSKLKGCGYIILDDVNDIKNWNSHQFLLYSSEYELLKENLKLRNGFSIWKKLTR